MDETYESIMFTPVVQELQKKYGSRRQYARMEKGVPPVLGEDEIAFLAEIDTFYMATVSETGWPYVQHRGGPKGFLKAIDQTTIAFADYRGNKQYISTGNLQKDNRVALILLDSPRRARLKILGRATILEGAAARDWIGKVHDPEYPAVVERVYVMRVEGFNWNCSQHIIPRYTAEQVQDAVAPLLTRIDQLEKQLAAARARSEEAGA